MGFGVLLAVDMVSVFLFAGKAVWIRRTPAS